MNHRKSLEQLKTNLRMSLTFFCPNFSSPFVKTIALSTSRVPKEMLINMPVCMPINVGMTRTMVLKKQTGIIRVFETTNNREVKYNVYGRRQKAKITSDFLFFSCNH